ncbi:MAG: hypothetical protein M1821_000940 [Bathelium mastoideum]|nr:MAG: hypothetical protein M1821_000940 [Bathelium mastoideum]KAI9694036.1 MAG: hypothetical protein M1822_003307 [Bathelium mastoideum]
MHGTDAFQLDPFPNDAANPIEDPDDVLQDFNSGMPLDFLWSPSTEDTPSCTALIGTIATAAPMQNLGSMDPYTEPNNRWQSLQDATPATTVPELSTSSTSPDFAQEPAPARTRKPSQPYHHGQDCMALALQVIYDLHVAREHCNTTASDPMTYMQTPREDPRDVDTVLFLNRDAIKSINKVLSCSYCSGDNSILLACYLAASKIVEWYAAAIGLATDGPEEDTGRGNYDSISDDQNHARPMSDRIISRPIFMGRYCLNAEVHRSVRAKVVLSELREHIQPLIGRLPKYHLSSSNLKGTKHGSSISSPLHKDIDGQLCALRNQVRKIIREASNINKHM